MRPAERFIQRLKDLQEGELSRLRRLAGRPLDHSLRGFDLFTGLWWPLREKDQAPRREPSWLVAKLYGSLPPPRPTPDGEPARLASILGGCEPAQQDARRRFRDRFDALLCSPLRCLEHHLRWALAVVAEAVERKQYQGLDWAQLLDDVSIWEQGPMHRLRRDVRDRWADEYLNAAARREEDL